MTTQAHHRWVIALLIGIGVASAAGAQPIDTRCLADGGDGLCTEPVAVASPPDPPVDGHDRHGLDLDQQLGAAQPCLDPRAGGQRVDTGRPQERGADLVELVVVALDVAQVAS